MSDRNPEWLVLDSAVPCEHVYGRAYDLRRHLLSKHGLVVEKGVVDAWAEDQRMTQSGMNVTRNHVTAVL